MEYPFKFPVLLLDDLILDKLGFSEYWDNHGDSGERNFRFNDSCFSVTIHDQTDDDSYGYSNVGMYISEYITIGLRHNKDCFEKKINRYLYFIHDLYEAILILTPEILDHFMSKCRQYNMMPYIDSYLEYKK